MTLPSGQPVFIYPKPDHEPATFTILNFVVATSTTPSMSSTRRVS